MSTQSGLQRAAALKVKSYGFPRQKWWFVNLKCLVFPRQKVGKGERVKRFNNEKCWLRKQKQQGVTLQYSNMLGIGRNSASNGLKWWIFSSTPCLVATGYDHIPTSYI